jgi:outer membrane immunogenic protein
MNRLFGALIAAASVIASVQIATAAPAINWTGFYVGGNVGLAWGRADTNYVPPGPPDGLLAPDQPSVAALASRDLTSSGFLGGVQAGFNYQFAPFLVFGVEADFQGFNLNKSFDGNFGTTPFGNQLLTHTEVDAHWLFTARGRLGYAADNWLIYATGGLAVAKINFEQINVMPDYPFTDTFSVSKTKTGWTIGGGVEYACRDRWSVKAEYLYVDFGNIDGTSTVIVLNPLIPVSFNHSADVRASIVRIGLNYRLN